jgi:SAM-dependent methyltransferase
MPLPVPGACRAFGVGVMGWKETRLAPGVTLLFVAGDWRAGDWRALNRANWDDRVPIHLASDFYDIAGFRAGADPQPPFEPVEMGDVAGKRLVHLQCHIGLDTLAWARRGARVTGLDFSAPAISAASSLASDLGIDASFVVSDVYDAAEVLGSGSFDVVYTGKGALVWIPDIPAWARVVAQLLRPGGFLYLVEGHPFAQVLEEPSSVSPGDPGLDSGDPGLVVARDYFDTEGMLEEYPWTYTDGPPLEHQQHVEFQHGMGTMVTALADAGLRIEFLHEHPVDVFQRFGSLRRGTDGLYRRPAGQPRVPLLFSLRASLPG